MTGTPAITVGAITGSSLALGSGGITAAGAVSGVTTLGMGGALSGVTTITNGAAASITSIGTPSYPVTNIYATTFTGALTGNCSGSSATCTGNAATATTAGGLTGTPAITVAAITGSSLALGSGGITAAGAISGVTTISNSASTAITSIGTSTRPVTNIYATTFTGALVGNADTATSAGSATTAGTAGGLTGTPAITVGTISCGAITSTGALALGSNTITSGNHIPNAASNTLGTSSSNWSNVYATSVTGGTVKAGTVATGTITTNAGLSLMNGGSYTPTQIEFQNGGSAGGYRHFITTSHSGTTDSTGNRIDFYINNSTTVDGSSQPATSNVNRLTISAVGVGVNVAAPGFMFDVAGQSRFGNTTSNTAIFLQSVTTSGPSNGTSIQSATYTGSSGAFLVLNPSGGNVGISTATATPSYALHVSGQIYATGSITSNSDGRLKNILAPISNGLEMLQLLNPVSFTMKDDDTSRVKYGFIAQEISNAFPELVYEVPDERNTLHMTYSDLIGPLVSAVKELSARLSNVEAQLAAHT